MPWFHTRPFAASLFLCVILALTGCVDRVDLAATQEWGGATLPVYGAHTVGQTFVATQPRLSAVELFWRSAPVESDLVLRLRDGSPEGAEIVQVAFTLPPSPQGYARRIHFPPVAASKNRRFYVELDAPHEALEQAPLLEIVPQDVYLTGNLYRDRSPTSGDLKFRAIYDYDLSLLLEDVLRKGLPKIWLVLPALALLWAPGYLLLHFLADGEQMPGFWERLALVVGISLACIPFLLLWVTQLGGALQAPLIRGFFGSLGVVAVGVALRRGWQRWRARPPDRAAWTFGGLMALILLSGLVVRLLAIRDLAVPAWVDSVHHTVVARIISETGRVPATYEPYVAVQQATYHFGFQADVAFFHGLTGLPLPQAMLILGQVLNGVTALQVFLLARWLNCSRRTALLAALITALLSTMPAYYVSWGRYTQLTGLAILPAAVILTTQAIERSQRRTWTLAILTLGGLTLTHYRVLAFYVCLMGAHWLAKAYSGQRHRLYEGARVASLLFISLLVLMPWIFEVATNLWGRAFRYWGGGGGTINWDFSLYYVTVGFDQYILGIAALGAVVGLVQRQRFPVVILLWLLSLFVITNPSLFNLPGEGLTNNTAMLIAWFMPLSILCGFLFDELLANWQNALSERWRTVGQIVFAGIFGVLAVLGLERQVVIVNPVCVLYHPFDQQAMEWIKRNTPQEAQFLINTTQWFPNLYAGSDGGFWIAPLTRRRTTLPPVLSGLGDPDYVRAIQDLARRAQAYAADPAALRDLMQQVGADYVYVGARGGALSAETFAGAQGFELVYANDRVLIYKVLPDDREGASPNQRMVRGR